MRATSVHGLGLCKHISGCAVLAPTRLLLHVGRSSEVGKHCYAMKCIWSNNSSSLGVWPTVLRAEPGFRV